MSDNRGPRERAYDDEIAPLMTQIIETAKQAGIPIFFHAVLDDDMSCTTAITGPDPDERAQMVTRLCDLARPPRQPSMRLTETDAEGNPTRITVFA